MERIPIRTLTVPNYEWYVLRVQGAFEKKASLALQVYGTAGAVPDFNLIRRCWVPEINVKSKGTSYKVRRVSTLPGYLFVEALLSDKLYTALKRPDLPHIFGWLQCRRNWPSIVDHGEVEQLLEWEQLNIDIIVTVPTFIVGEKVSFPSMNVTGMVSSITDNAIFVSVDIFHRPVMCRISKQFFGEVVRIDE